MKIVVVVVFLVVGFVVVERRNSVAVVDEATTVVALASVVVVLNSLVVLDSVRVRGVLYVSVRVFGGETVRDLVLVLYWLDVLVTVSDTERCVTVALSLPFSDRLWLLLLLETFHVLVGSVRG